jgi:glutamate formiminotransferase
MKKLMCVPNVSEGRDVEKIEKLTAAIRETPGVTLMDVSSDEDHNRSVFSYMGDSDAVLTATKRLAETVFEIVDMTTQTGSHPRQGALDVTPFIPVGDTTTDEALAVARAFGAFVASKGIPVYYYEAAATSPQRVSLVDVRVGQYEGLEEKIRRPEWAPDEGPATFVPRAGSVQVSVRPPLVAFNVNLRTDDLDIAKQIADAVRHKQGGYRYVRAIGLSLGDLGMVQVSMNLTDSSQTPIHRVFETIRSEAERHGVSVAGTELVGPVPLPALIDVARFYLQVHGLSMDQVIETST